MRELTAVAALPVLLAVYGFTGLLLMAVTVLATHLAHKLVRALLSSFKERSLSRPARQRQIQRVFKRAHRAMELVAAGQPASGWQRW